MKRFGGSLEFIVLLYFLSYLPSIVVTRLVTTTGDFRDGRPLTGLETLPASLIVSLILTYAFIWMSGWYRDANRKQVGSWNIPWPTRYTFLSGIGTALVLFTVPLSLTFEGVSIPFIQLLMRGDILVIAPVVDLLFGRRVRWWSWVALVLVAASLLFVIQQRGGLGLPPLAIATIVLYTLGYFIRLAVMTRVSKSGDPAAVRRYFVEEKVVAIPLSIVALALLSVTGIGSQAGELSWGFVDVWTSAAAPYVIFIGVMLTIISVFAAIILLDARENSYCVPLERSASLLAGIGAAFILAEYWGQRPPTGPELIGAAILVAVIVLLSIAPRMDRKRAAAEIEARAETA